MQALNETLDAIARLRYHGAKNISGIRFQLLYSLLRAFDLYSNSDISEVQFEGLEDVDLRVDLKKFRIGDTHIQVKTSSSAKTWSWLEREKVLDHFIEVYKINSGARFVVVANFSFNGVLNELARYCNRQVSGLSAEATKKVAEIATRCGLNNASIDPFLRQISFEYLDATQLSRRLEAACIASLELTAGNEALYISRLFSRSADWATGQKTITRRDLDAEKLWIDEQISLGVINPAVQDRLIQFVRPDAETQVGGDYYEGKKARLGHIIANLDIPRPRWQRAISEAFSHAKVVIIRASSGQGKSTLLYRYAYDTSITDAVFRIRVCSEDRHVGQIVDYIRTRLKLGVPLLILIDDLSFPTRYWHQIASELAGEDIRFLVATREDDWYRYGLNTSGFTWQAVKPELDIEEARNIFKAFQQKGKIAPNVLSADWAYEQVAEKKLLIEYVFLITQGVMLAERLEEQVRLISERDEDPAKLDILRLVATAQVYDARISVDALLTSVQFRTDPQAVLKSLQNEYIEIVDGMCDGLHFVRSDYLMNLLHEFVAREGTIVRLLGLLNKPNLRSFIPRIFADTNLVQDVFVPTLLKRVEKEPLSSINSIIEALFVAGETLYFLAHKHLYDEAIAHYIPSILLIAAATSPLAKVNAVAEMRRLMPEARGFAELDSLIQQFEPRSEINTQQAVQSFVKVVAENIPLAETPSLTDLGQFSEWCRIFEVAAPRLDEFFRGIQWEGGLLESDDVANSDFLQALYGRNPERYHQYFAAHKPKLFAQFKGSFDVVSLQEADKAFQVEFIVDELSENVSVNDTAVTILKQARQWFPTFDRYQSQGVYASTGGQAIEIDAAHKDMEADTLDLTLKGVKNALYRQLIEDYYAPRLLFEWSQKWSETRRKGIALARYLIEMYEAVFDPRPSTSINQAKFDSLYQGFVQTSNQAPQLPTRLRARFGEQSRAISDWQTSFNNFTAQFAQHDPNDLQQNMSRLMRHNLLESVTKLPAMQKAFATIFQYEPDSAGMRVLNDEERMLYSRLAEIIDYWFAHGIQKVANLAGAIKGWRDEDQQNATKRVRQALEPLVDAGFAFYYPSNLLNIFPLKGLCIGFEITDFSQILEQVFIVMAVIAPLDIDYQFLYVAPSVRKHLYGSKVWRIGRDTLQQLAAGNLRDGVYPVEPPTGMVSILPELDGVTLPDVALYQRLEVVYNKALLQRNTLTLAQKLLNKDVPEEQNLLQRYEREIEALFKQSRDAAQALYAEGMAFTNASPASVEWSQVWLEGLRQIKEITDLTLSINIRPVTQETALYPTFSGYLNRRYRS